MTKQKFVHTIIILGSLAALGPFSIDMYLPGFIDIAKDLKTTESSVAISLSSFFIGISAGQLLYGPLLDKFGRKKPLLLGLTIYIISSFVCLWVVNVEQLILLRFIQAIGSCATAVASIAMVRDLFTTEESPKVFSALMLVIAVSPMLAPTIGGYVIALLGWKYVFVILALMALAMLLAVYFKLPESYKPDPNYSLKPKPILNSFYTVLKTPQFYTYSFICALTFAGLFAYISASPTVFMKLYKVDKTVYGWIFAILSVFFVGFSQVNTIILKWFSSKKIITFALIFQVYISLIFLFYQFNGWLSLNITVVFIALFLGCLGLINPNAAALSLAPFDKNAGSASALMGAMQMGLGAIITFIVSLFTDITLAMPLIMTIVAATALFTLFLGPKSLTKN